jgi:hypothetical protein
MIYTDDGPIYCAICNQEYTYNPKKFTRIFLDNKTYYVCIKCTREAVSDKIRKELTNGRENGR